MSVVSRRRVWVESICVASGCSDVINSFDLKSAIEHDGGV